jgi:hypothetical protein
MFFPVVDVDRHPDLSSSVMLVQPFLNTVIHSYTFHCGRALFPYCAERLSWIAAPGTP